MTSKRKNLKSYDSLRAKQPPFYICVTFIQYSLVGQVFFNNFEPVFLKYTYNDIG
jgi:hypothetical protein